MFIFLIDEIFLDTDATLSSEAEPLFHAYIILSVIAGFLLVILIILKGKR